MEYNIIKGVAFRFLRGFLSGSVAVLATIQVVAPANWADLGSILNTLAIAGIVGGLSGGFLALDKYLRVE
ncbi:MAG: hypothetical protein IPM48_14595 [Saprospiraceae bacterium]|nr:hypothetical protein [Saprospiraceae bacterium]